MKISWNWLSEMVDLSGVGGPQGLAALLTSRGLEVEAVDRQDQGFEKVVAVEIVSREKHPQADRLSICMVNLGSGEPLQIVCGAQNMKAGDKVPLAQVGAELPNGMKIKKGEIRSVVSNGMLCSEQELGLSKESEGLLILPPSTPIGKPMAEVLGRNDTILTFKLTANRGDCMSHFGMAREVAAALGKNVKRPEAPSLPSAMDGKSPISIHLEAGDAGPQFFGTFIEGVKVGPSPEWLVKRLEAVGSRSINNIVDATNLVLLELGQPVHAYDADLLEGGKIRVRMAEAGEVLPLLDATSVQLLGTELVIADAKRAVALAGVMGGGNSEVREKTHRVYLEVAEFSPKLVRQAASKHQKRTDAAQRFERGIDPEGLGHAMARLTDLVIKLAGGKIVGADKVQLAKCQRPQIEVAPSYFENFLGMSVTPEQAEKILTGLGCKVEKKGAWLVTSPSWRRDLVIREDLAEEVARSIGYDAIRETIPPLSTAPASQAQRPEAARLRQMNQTKDLMRDLGLLETVNFAFTSKSWLSKFGMASSASLLNPLSEELEALVPSLLPGLVQNALGNWSRHFGSEALPIRLFELRPVFSAGPDIRAQGEMETGVKESWRLSAVLSGPRVASGMRNELGEMDFADVKAIFERLLEGMGTRGLRLSPMSASRSGGNPMFHPGRSVEVLAGKGDVVGAFGLMHPGLSRDHKCRAPLWLFELDWEQLYKFSRKPGENPVFKPWSEFPSMERDFALLVPKNVVADKITQVAVKAGKPLAKVAKVFDVYTGSQVAEGMTSVAVRVTFSEESRSLQESEAEAASAQILAAWKQELGIELRS